MSALKRLLPAALLLLVAACGRESGPVEITYDRDACEMCGMIISSPRYVTEIRLAADNKPHKFDDIGDAMNWLEKDCKSLDEVGEIWVMVRPAIRPALMMGRMACAISGVE